MADRRLDPATSAIDTNAHLADLEARAGLDVRRIVEVLIDTGRRPEEACQLPWDCLDTTADGHQVLIYTGMSWGLRHEIPKP